MAILIISENPALCVAFAWAILQHLRQYFVGFMDAIDNHRFRWTLLVDNVTNINYNDYNSIYVLFGRRAMVSKQRNKLTDQL